MDIKIFACYHKAAQGIHSDIIQPLHVGKALSTTDLGFPGDDTGDNISAKNLHYCELTATYWIWKNVQADVVGLFHYRRLLNLSNAHTKVHKTDAASLAAHGLTAENITSLLSRYHALLPHECSFDETIYEQYLRAHVASDIDTALSVIDEKYPHMSRVADAVIRNGSRMYGTNMLVAPKPLFDEYASWLFDILFEVERRVHASVPGRDAYQQRIYGFLSERLMGVFVTYKQQVDGLKFMTFPALCIEEDEGKWNRYRFHFHRRRLLAALGLGKKRWQRQV